MKKLFAVLLSLQLMILPVAIAQGSGDQFRSNPEAKAGGMDLYAKQILALSTSAIGTSILTSCSFGTMLMSMKVFMAGTLVHITSEIMGGKAQNENHTKRAKDLEMVTEKMKGTAGGDVQKEALEQALKEEKATLAFINKRKMWLMAVTAIYLAATGLAIMEMIKHAPPSKIPPLLGKANCNGTISSIKGIALSAAYGFGAGKIGGGGAISTYGGFALAMATKIKALSGMIQKSYELPMTRAITFGASTALVGLVMTGLMSRAKVTSENIKKLESVLANFKANSQPGNGLATDQTGGAGSGSGADGGRLNLLDGKNYAINTLADGTQLPKECWSSSSQGMEMSTAACKNPVRLPSPKFEGSISVPTLSSAAVAANQMGQASANGDIAGAESSAASLASMAGSLRKVNENLAKQLNDKLKAEGKKPIDFDAESKAMVASMGAGLNSGSGASGAGLASSGSDSSSDLLKDENADDKKSNVNTASAGAVIDVPSATGGVVTEGLVNDPSLAEVTATEAPADYEYNEQDVSEKQDVTLFQQVSNRYLFQYNKIFKRDEPKPEPVK